MGLLTVAESSERAVAMAVPRGVQVDMLEAAAVLDHVPYVLEVSSPGIGEELLTDRDYTSFRGFPVEVLRRTAEGSDSRREGLLLERDGEAVHLNVRGRRLRIPRQEVVRVRLVSPRDGP